MVQRLGSNPNFRVKCPKIARQCPKIALVESVNRGNNCSLGTCIQQYLFSATARNLGTTSTPSLTS